MVREVTSTGRCCAIAWMVLVLKEAKCFHSSPSGECPHSAFRFIVVILIGGTGRLVNRGRVSAETGDMSASHIITPQ